MSRISLTGRQRDCFDFIAQFITEQRRSPSLREIAKGIGIKNHSSVAYMIDALQERGWITKLPNRKNSISIIPGENSPADGDVLDRILGPALWLKLRLYADRIGDDPLHVLADAAALHLDQAEGEDDVAA